MHNIGSGNSTDISCTPAAVPSIGSSDGMQSLLSHMRLHSTLVSPAASWTVQCLSVSTKIAKAGDALHLHQFNVVSLKDTHR